MAEPSSIEHKPEAARLLLATELRRHRCGLQRPAAVAVNT
jgi:hypothetical protein